ncbi:Sec-independent protein translocase protein TatB [Lysobacter koreensis]|uniref:Sec-independent protein translocase protein TatB n=1 Tax=Lysobacter koreensis TaxID=266122 RepID=A0ABW2YNG3_9GAMM
MFDIGFSELFVIAIVALLVLGPERLPKAARFAGLWVRRARAQWYSVKSELENELADDELRRSLQQTRQQLMDARDQLQRGGQSLQDEFDPGPRDNLELAGSPDHSIARPAAAARVSARDPAPPSDATPGHVDDDRR